MKKSFDKTVYYIVSILLLTVSMNCTASSWMEYGNYDISWFSTNQKEFSFKDPKQIAGIAYLVNQHISDFEGYSFRLDNDINLNGKDWIPIGGKDNPFKGSIDGNGFRISGISVSGHDSDYVGFFGNIHRCTVRNLYIDGTVRQRDQASIRCGLVSGRATQSTIENVNVNLKLSLDMVKPHDYNNDWYWEWYHGGVVGDSEYCDYSSIESNAYIQDNIGGQQNHQSDISRSIYMGGIVGRMQGGSINKCIAHNNYNSSSYLITSENHTINVIFGGIVGLMENSKSSDPRPYKITTCAASNYVAGYYNMAVYTGYFNMPSGHFKLGGILGTTREDKESCFLNKETQIECCVAINRQFEIEGTSTKYISTWSILGGILGSVEKYQPSIFSSNYSNSDCKTVYKDVKYQQIGVNGSNSYTSARMHTQSFIDEINQLNYLKFNERPWVLDSYNSISLRDIGPYKPTVAIEKITIVPTEFELHIGESKELSTQIIPANATDKSVEWKSTDTAVAIVTSDGKVTAVSEGKAKITCTALDGSGASGSCLVTVIGPEKDNNEFTYQGINYVILDGVESYTNVIASNVVTGSRFAIVADGNIAYPPAEEKNYGYLNTSEIKEDAVGIHLSQDQSICNFTIESTPDGNYYLKDSYGRYLYMVGSYNSFNVSYDLPEEGAVWRITVRYDDSRVDIYNLTTGKYIQYDPKYETYGVYSEERGILPKLYVETPNSTTSTSTKRMCMTKPGEAWSSSGSKISGDLCIPETVSNGVEDFTVVAVGEWSFVYEDILSVKFPNTILSIGNGAFFCCKDLSSIELPKSLINLGYSVFCGCEISSIFIPSSLSTIGQFAFACENLTKITVVDDNPLYSSYEGVLYDKDRRILINVPQGLTGDFSISSTVSIIDQRAFESCSFSSITIPSSIRIIEDRAFVNAEFNDLYYNTTDPITAEKNIFFSPQYNSITLYVPAEALEKIRVTEPWKNFEKIEVYDFNEYSSLKSLSEAIEKARLLEVGDYSDPYFIDFEPIVTYVNGSYNYISHEATPFLIYKENLGVEAGQIINKGWTGRLHNYYGLLEFVPLDNVEISGGEIAGIPDPVRIENATEIKKELLSAVVYIPNVVFNEATPEGRTSFTGRLGNQYLIFYNNFAMPSNPAGTYDVLATISIYYDQLEIQPIEFMTPNAIDEIYVEGEEEYFDLQGHRVMHPQKGGVYIRKKGRHFNKVVISM